MRGRYSDIVEALKGTDLKIFFVGVGLFLVTICVAAYRFLLLAKAQAGCSIRFADAAALGFIGLFFNNFLPTSVGGDVAKAYLLSKKTGNTLGSFAAVLVDRFVGLVTMILMACVALLFINSSIVNDDIRQMLYIFSIVALIAVLVIMNRFVAGKLAKILRPSNPLTVKLKKAYDAVHRYRHHRRLMVKSFFISIASQLLCYTSFGVVALSIGSNLRPLDILLRMPLVSIMSMLPSVNGLGLREGATVIFFGSMIGKGHAFAVSILWLLVLSVTSILGGLIYAISPQFHVKLKTLKIKESEIGI
jgi:uncharacterized protein (TIRG00374 family)